MSSFTLNVAAVAVIATTVSASTHEWSRYDGTGCEYTLLEEPVSWFKAARVCHDLGDGAQLSTVWSAGEAQFISNVRRGEAAWVFGFYEDGLWNLNFGENKLWSPAEPKDESAFAFCARQADDAASSIRFQSTACTSEYSTICKRCVSKEHHFKVAEESVEVTIAPEEKMVADTRVRRQAATTTTTTTTTTVEPEPVMDGGDADGADQESISSSASSTPVIAAIVCIAATVMLVGAIIKRKRALEQAHIQEVADKFSHVLHIDEDDAAVPQLEWADDDLSSLSSLDSSVV